MYIFVEVIRLFQSPLIKYDDNLYDLNSNKHSYARTSELPDELGQVNYILSDKTGTLTCNNMVLEHISVDDKIFQVEELGEYLRNKYKIYEPSKGRNSLMKKDLKSRLHCAYSAFDNLNRESNVSSKTDFNDNELSMLDSKSINHIKFNKDLVDPYENKLIDFFRLVNICNSIVINFNKKKDDKDTFVYQVRKFDFFILL